LLGGREGAEEVEPRQYLNLVHAERVAIKRARGLVDVGQHKPEHLLVAIGVDQQDHLVRVRGHGYSLFRENSAGKLGL